MTVLVAKSYGVGDAGLNFNAALYEQRQNNAAVWDLRPAAKEVPSTESIVSRLMTNEGSESVIGADDGRKLVSDVDLSPGGKYRSIVKILTHHEFQPQGQYCHGTGWLISDDIFVTAGHCSYDWSYHKYGRAIEVKAYIGYKGKGSIHSPNVQFRSVKRIATTGGWVTMAGSRAFDVSFMQVDQPFTGITPFRFAETPASGELNLGVVGYPGDLKENGEAGARMYEMYLPTKFNLTDEKDRMLQYEIDTFGGNSGSPVFAGGASGVSIGVHVYGGSINSASVIGRFGNAFTDYLQAFTMGPLRGEGVNLVPLGRGKPIPALEALVHPNVTASFTQAGSTGVTKTGGIATTTTVRSVRGASVSLGSKLSPQSGDKVLMDVLHKAHKVTLTRSTNNPHSLGNVGSPAAALAGVSLNTAIGATLEHRHGGTESLSSSSVAAGAVHRAILAEATLSAIEAHPLPAHLEEAFFDDMKHFVVGALPTVKKIGKQVLGVATESALKLALDELHRHNQRSAGTESFSGHITASAKLPSVHTIQGDHSTEAFVNKLSAGAESAGQEEGWIDIIKVGARVGGKLLGGIFGGAEAFSDEESWWEDGLKIVGGVGRSLVGGFLGESLETGDDPHSDAHLKDALAQRALVAEAALQAVMKTPPESLEEGFIDFIRDGVKSIGSTVVRYAPAVLNGVKNIAVSAIQKQFAPQGNAGHESFAEVPRAGQRQHALQGHRTIMPQGRLQILRA